MAEPARAAEQPTDAAQLCEQAARSVAQDRPFFVVVFYRHEGEKLEFLEAVRQGLRERGLQSRTYDPAHNPEHGAGKLYGLLAQGGAETIHLVADLARGEDGGFDRDFLGYLNLHRDTINRQRLRLVLFVHDSEAEVFLHTAGDLWDFRQRTIWLERPAEPRGEGVWQEVIDRAVRLPKSDAERQEIERHVAEVRAQANDTSDPGDRAGLLLDLTWWLLRKEAANSAEEAAREALQVSPESDAGLRLEIENAYAMALSRQEQNPEALRHLERALRLSREIGNREREAISLNNISQIYDTWGRYDGALQHLQQSLEINREIGDRAGEALTLNNIGSIYYAWGRYDEALQHLQQSLEISREIGNRHGEARSLNNISQIYQEWDRYDEALQHIQQSLTIQREIGNRVGEAAALNNLSRIYYTWERFDEALLLLQQSLQIEREIGNRAGEALALSNNAQIYSARGRYDEVLHLLQQSLRIQREIGDRAGEAFTLWNLGCEYERRDELTSAVECLTASVALKSELGHPDAANNREYLRNMEARLRNEVATRAPKASRAAG